MHTKSINTGYLDSRKLQKGRHDMRGHLLDTASVDKKRTRVPASVGWGNIGSGGLEDWGTLNKEAATTPQGSECYIVNPQLHCDRMEDSMR